MVCNFCGTQNNDDAAFCAGCGASLVPAAPEAAPVAPAAPVYYAAPTAAPAVVPGKGLAIAALVLGIISFFCFPVITGTLGIVFGGMAKSKGYKGGMAIAGIVCGVIGVALWAIMLAANVSLFSMF